LTELSLAINRWRRELCNTQWSAAALRSHLLASLALSVRVPGCQKLQLKA